MRWARQASETDEFAAPQLVPSKTDYCPANPLCGWLSAKHQRTHDSGPLRSMPDFYPERSGATGAVPDSERKVS
jgi:hypothetical protein